jgi:hypothetical protein
MKTRLKINMIQKYFELQIYPSEPSARLPKYRETIPLLATPAKISHHFKMNQGIFARIELQRRYLSRWFESSAVTSEETAAVLRATAIG